MGPTVHLFAMPGLPPEQPSDDGAQKLAIFACRPFGVGRRFVHWSLKG